MSEWVCAPGRWCLRIRRTREIFISDEWGTICDSLWGLEEASVVCRQLNYSGADLALVAGDYGQGEGPVHLGSVQCAGTETNLSYCQSADDPQCDHTRDVGVVCTTHGKIAALILRERERKKNSERSIANLAY